MISFSDAKCLKMKCLKNSVIKSHNKKTDFIKHPPPIINKRENHMIAEQQIAKAKAEKQSIKCIVWDLDNTLWKGVLLEDVQVDLFENMREILETLDQRGVLQAIASKNDYDTAMKQLKSYGLDEYFLYPQINWNSKSSSIRAIAESLNIGLDSIAFIDDQSFEREEVSFALPEVMCIDSADLDHLLAMPELQPRFITSESKLRRQMYLSDIKRKEIEDSFIETDESFLATLDMAFSFKPAEEADLQRAEELTVRTNQLNTTGYTYDYDELNQFRLSDNHLLLSATLDDKYGTYGTIGLALVELTDEVWTLKLLLMSCRVMSRGVGTIMMSHVMNEAKKAGVRLQAEFLRTDRNKMMFVTYKFGGFKQVGKKGDLVILEHDLTRIQPFPEHVKLHIEN